jgi:1-acyl-sn-glycerol-3-phosphate acyltransferase
MFYWVVKAILWPFLRLVFRPWAEGADNVPRTGAAILASNHLSFSDHFFAPLPLPRKVVFLAKSEYFTGPGLKGLFSKAFFSGVGQIPVDRAGGAASERALATGLRALANGYLLGIYPEGTRTPDGRLFRGKTGVARLALEARVPVIPCAMIGGFEFQPPGTIAPRLRIRPGVRFGKPLDFSRYYGLESDRIVLRAVTDEIIYEIMKLSGQEYVDEYAQRHKARVQARRARRLAAASASATGSGSGSATGSGSGSATGSGSGSGSGSATGSATLASVPPAAASVPAAAASVPAVAASVPPAAASVPAVAARPTSASDPATAASVPPVAARPTSASDPATAASDPPVADAPLGGDGPLAG